MPRYVWTLQIEVDAEDLDDAHGMVESELWYMIQDSYGGGEDIVAAGVFDSVGSAPTEYYMEHPLHALKSHGT